jgi:CubicO group peptidase (beta-lactamase class C family)
MTDLKVDVDPVEAGFDAERLERIDRHFQPYVDDGRLPGWLVVVAREGQVAYLSRYGQRDMEAAAPVELDTIWRFYSMTKPITSLAMMMLYEQGAFDLRDPVVELISSFADARVFIGGTAADPVTEPVQEPVRIWHLLSHTSGLTYAQGEHPVVEGYRAAEARVAAGDPSDLAAWVDAWASQPLLFHPGTRWHYSRATDVLGRLVEVISGQPLHDYFAERILGPLQMTDTTFEVPESKVDRLASLYEPDPDTHRAVPAADPRARRTQKFDSGGGGLLSTAVDYQRFCQLLLRGGELDGVRLVSPKTIRFMASNHLPEGRDMSELASEGFSETGREGRGFGLGFSVVLDPARTKILGSRGEFAWGGAASTVFWIDPRERLTVLFLTQLRPSSTWPIRSRLSQLVYQALIEPGRGWGRPRG